jgi:hypothetical protein
MAISFVSPSGEVSIQDDLWHIATSSNSGQTDFKYVYDVYYNGQQLIRSKVFSDPLNGKGYFNASQVVRNEITFDYFKPVQGTNICISQPSTSGQIAVTYQVSYGEDFSGVTTLNLASGNTTAYNYIPPIFNRRKLQLNNWNNRFLTNRPLKTLRHNLLDRVLIGVKSLVNGRSFDVRAYNNSNTLMWQESLLYNQTPTGNPFLQLDIGAVNINSVLSNDITSDVNYWEVGFTNTITESVRIYNECNTKYTPILLHFINSFGMFDTARFQLVNKLSIDLERKTFSKRDYSFNGNAVDYYDTNNVYKESLINYGSKINSKYSLTMNYPTDEEYIWLADLIISPQVFAEIDGSFYAVSIINTNYEYSKNVNNGLRALQIDIAMNQTRYGYKR